MITVKKYARPGRKDRKANRLGLLAQIYMDIERHRVAQQVRQSHLALDGSPLADDPVFEGLFTRLVDTQEYVDKMLAPLVLQHPCWKGFGLHVKGVGPHLLGLITGLIRDITPFTTVSKLWYLCGLAVLEGETQHREKGVVVNYDQRLKAILLGRLGTQLLRNGDPFARHLYDTFKAQEEVKLAQLNSREEKEAQPKKASHEPQETLGKEASQEKQEALNDKASQMREEAQQKQAFSPHRRAIRKVVKLWIACLWAVWREAEGLPVSQPYAISILGHQGLVTAQTWIDYNLATKKEANHTRQPTKNRRSQSSHEA